MNDIKILLKKDALRIFSPIVNLKNKSKSKEQKNKLIMWIILIPSFIILFKTMTEFVNFMYDAFKSANRVSDIFELVLFSSIFLLILNVLPYTLSKLYHNKENEFTLSLPIKGKNIITTTMIEMLILEIMWMLVFFLPAMIRFSKDNPVPFTYYLGNIISISFYLLGIVAIVSFIWIVMMRALSKFGKIKYVLQIIFMFITVSVIIGIQKISSASAMSSVNPERMNNIQNSSQSIINKISTFMPQNDIVLKPLYEFNTTTMITSLVFSIAFGIILTIVFSNLAYKPWLKGYNNYQTSNVKKIKKEKISKYVKYKEKSLISTLIKKELLNIVKTPVYFFNIAFGGIIFPVIMFIPLLTNDNIRQRVANFPKFKEVATQFGLSNLDLFCISILLGIVLGFLFCLGGSSVSTSISREGKQIYLMQSLPIKAREQVLSRIIAGTILSVMEALPISIILLIFLKAPIYLLLFITLGSLIPSYAINSYCLLVDILKPKLEWTDPQGAVKQNFNALINLLVNFGYIALNVWTFKTLLDGRSFNVDSLYITCILLIAINIFVSVIFYFIDTNVWKDKISKYNL